MPPSHDGPMREKWPVLICRLQSHRGWEVYCDPDVERVAAAAAASSSLGKKHNSSSATTNSTSKKSTGGGGGGGSISGGDNVEELTAAPREGCIEVRKMRLRIRLFAQHKPWDASPTVAATNTATASSASKLSSNIASASQKCGDNNATTAKESTATDVGKVDNKSTKSKKDDEDDGYDTDTPGPDGWNNNALLVRRRNTLLVTTRRGWGALVFQFKSVRDCIDFCDRLVYLNRNLLMPPKQQLPPNEEEDENRHMMGNHDNMSKNRSYVNGMDKREQYIAELNSMKRRKLAILGDQEVCAPKYNNSLHRLHASSTDGETNNNNDSNDTTSGMNGTKAPGLVEAHTSQYQYRRESIMNYIVQLAYSEEFRGFVDEFERGLTSSAALADEVDGLDICAALGF